MIHGFQALDSDSREVCIIILCLFLCQFDIYSRYLLMSRRPKYYSTFLRDFEMSKSEQQQEQLEDSVIKEEKLKRMNSSKIKHIKNHYINGKGKSFMKKILKRKQQVEQLEDDDKMDPDGLLQEVDLNPPSYSINTNEVSMESEEFESANDNLENKAIEKLWDIIKIEDTLKMGNDFYSLAFYGFYLEDDEEELSAHHNIQKVKGLIKGQKHFRENQ